MHPFNGLFNGREIINMVRLSQGFVDALAWRTQLPMTSELEQQYAVATMYIMYTDAEGFTLASDEDIMFFVYCDTIIG